MKKIILISVFMLLFNCLVACDPLTYFLNYDELKEHVVMIELINYDNPDSKIINAYKEKVKPFDFEKVEILETLSEYQIDSFLKSLSEVVFHLIDEWTNKCTDSANGITIILRYKDGDFLVLSGSGKSNFVALYDSQGRIKEHKYVWTSFGYFEDMLVNKYFTAYHYDGYSRY